MMRDRIFFESFVVNIRYFEKKKNSLCIVQFANYPNDIGAVYTNKAWNFFALSGKLWRQLGLKFIRCYMVFQSDIHQTNVKPLQFKKYSAWHYYWYKNSFSPPLHTHTQIQSTFDIPHSWQGWRWLFRNTHTTINLVYSCQLTAISPFIRAFP